MNRNENPRKVLGRGMNTLLGARTQAPPSAPETQPLETGATVPIDAIDVNPLQPRRIFQAERLMELAQSIRANGVIQPLVVRKFGDRYQLVAGERRWRAAKMAELTEVPVVVKDIPDEHLLEITLVENIQREDLNPIETATALSRMGTELGLNPEEIGRRTGKDRTTILNFTRLLQLPSDLQQLIGERRLSAGHGRCLLSLPSVESQREVAQKAVTDGWSVRQMERVTQKMIEGEKPKRVEEVDQDPNVKAAIQELQRVLGTKVRIIEGAKKKGRLEIDYYSQEDLDRIYSVIVGES
jgi:ParB family chromosome partitioning protein